MIDGGATPHVVPRSRAAFRVRHAAAAHIRPVLRGSLLCLALVLGALALQAIEISFFRRAWLEVVLLAILLGIALRGVWEPGKVWTPGINFCAKQLLEFGVMLLGASINVPALMHVAPGLAAGVAVIVGVSIVASYAIGRLFRLPPRMAMLVACGNSICGNSAIAAAAPTIGADQNEIAASIAYTAALGLVVVLALPLVAPRAGLSPVQYGVLAGITVYSVPQVLAATAPVSAVSVQIGTMVKLGRVLMLGPVILALGCAGWGRVQDVERARQSVPLGKLVPWFVIGFAAFAVLRASGLLPPALLPAVAWIAELLTVLAMAALGLGVNPRTVFRAGTRALAVVGCSVFLLVALSLTLIRVLAIT
jgi:uncharacterized integral membrane protein (TIGR00698 family)